MVKSLLREVALHEGNALAAVETIAARDAEIQRLEAGWIAAGRMCIKAEKEVARLRGALKVISKSNLWRGEHMRQVAEEALAPTEPTSDEDEPEQTPAEKATGEKLLRMYRGHQPAPTSAEDEASAARDIPGYAEMCVKIAKDLEREQQAQGMVLLWQELWDGGILTQEQSDEIARRIKAHRKGV